MLLAPSAIVVFSVCANVAGEWARRGTRALHLGLVKKTTCKLTQETR